MSVRRNKATAIKCLVVVLGLMVAIPLLLRLAPAHRNDVLQGGVGGGAGGEAAAGEGGGGKEDPVRRAVPPQQQQPHQQQQQPADPGPVRLIDWHDRAAIGREKLRTGPGEGGSAYILSAEEEKLKSPLYQVNGFNALASDRISLDRSLSDIRHPDCRAKMYSSRLPTASVVIPFHNEWPSVLLR